MVPRVTWWKGLRPIQTQKDTLDTLCSEGTDPGWWPAGHSYMQLSRGSSCSPCYRWGNSPETRGNCRFLLVLTILLSWRRSRSELTVLQGHEIWGESWMISERVPQCYGGASGGVELGDSVPARSLTSDHIPGPRSLCTTSLPLLLPVVPLRMKADQTRPLSVRSVLIGESWKARRSA